MYLASKSRFIVLFDLYQDKIRCKNDAHYRQKRLTVDTSFVLR